MSSQVTFSLKGRNPDVLNSIANLSSDEIFTPPELVGKMLDSLEVAWAKSHGGASIWTDSSVRFLDPFTKSGVFLREITRRLVQGLTNEFPDLQSRVDHILSNQVFGIAITQLTAHLARRSLYCSKAANGEHSICSNFDDESGNIWFERMNHDWVGGSRRELRTDESGVTREVTVDGRCRFCKAAQSEYDRGPGAETHAYALTHTEQPIELIQKAFGSKMKFDVVIGNPPYQLSDGGHSASAAPIYQKFVEQAFLLEPRFVVVIIPSRWFAGGKGLDEFRDKMLNDKRVSTLHDYADASEVFPGVEIKGGVCYFVWSRDYDGPADITFHNGHEIETSRRYLLEDGIDVYIRQNAAIEILRKCANNANKSLGISAGNQFSKLVSSRKPFGLDTSVRGESIAEKLSQPVILFQNGGTSFFERSQLKAGDALVDTWKIFISYAYGAGNSFPHSILGTPIVAGPGTACTETYLAIGPFDSEAAARSAASYICTRIFRFLVLQRKPTQHATKSVYNMVPVLPFTETWTDEKLATQFALTVDEMKLIESQVKEMAAGDEPE